MSRPDPVLLVACVAAVAAFALLGVAHPRPAQAPVGRVAPSFIEPKPPGSVLPAAALERAQQATLERLSRLPAPNPQPAARALHSIERRLGRAAPASPGRPARSGAARPLDDEVRDLLRELEQLAPAAFDVGTPPSHQAPLPRPRREVETDPAAPEVPGPRGR